MGSKPSSEAELVSNIVIGSEFITPNGIEIIVDTKSKLTPKGGLLITDVNHNVMVKVKSRNSLFHDQRLLIDPYDKPIVLLRKKVRSEHERWEVYRGDKKKDSNLIFSTKTPNMNQFKTKLKVLLAANNKDTYDFKIQGSWSKKNCTIYIGDSSTIIAQMHKKPLSKNAKLDKHKFMVTIYPNVDYAFVVALIAIIHAMKKSSSDELDTELTKAVIGVAGAVVGGGS